MISTRFPQHQAAPSSLNLTNYQFHHAPTGILTPATQSPTSPMISHPTRSHGSHRTPLFLPAVLRPTKREDCGPPTPPRSVYGSTDSFDRKDTPIKASQGLTLHPTAAKISTLSKTTREPTILSLDPPIETPLPLVTGPPKRSHWTPDTASLVCSAPLCNRTFSLFERRHHCRHCGDIFCRAHSSSFVPLDQDAEFHPKGEQVRSCDHCHAGYRRWRKARGSPESSVQSESGCETPTTPTLNTERRGRMDDGRGFAASAPKGWTWSTF